MVNCDTLEKHGGTCFPFLKLQSKDVPSLELLPGERERSWENKDGLGRAKLVQSYHNS